VPPAARLGLKEVRGDVPLQVVDRCEGKLTRGGDRLPGRQSDEQRADQPRPLRRSDELHVVEPVARLLQGGADHDVDELG